ncbi:hypothetical protein ACGYLO_16500 [Sulfitobacter sp. 1A13353]|uniref:hypothetical protein n=1 Tax=Sulfitobacter sp. 1A13353 TaxID=3368568 RepID=UPI003745136E
MTEVDISRNAAELQASLIERHDSLNVRKHAAKMLRAQAALIETKERDLVGARNSALREAASVAGKDFFDRALTAPAAEHASEIEEAILELIEGDAE